MVGNKTCETCKWFDLIKPKGDIRHWERTGMCTCRDSEHLNEEVDGEGITTCQEYEAN
jgi:hypothetical protein